MKTNLSTHPKKMSRKELAAPDDFQRIGKAISGWVTAHPRYIVGAVVVLVAVGIAALSINLTEQHREEQAADAFSAALHALDRPVGTQSNGELPQDAKPFKSQKDADQALVKALSPLEQKYTGTDAGASAALLVGESELRLGKNGDALKHFAHFLAERPVTDPLRAVALEGQGYAYEAEGKLDAALASFEALDTESTRTHLLEGMGLFHQARILIRQGHPDEAAQKLAKIPQQFPNSAAARMASQKLELLASEGVKVPTPKPVVMSKPSDPGA